MKRHLTKTLVLMTACVMMTTLAPSAQAGIFQKGESASADCDQFITPITSGYGANGQYATETVELAQADYSDPVEVFFPKGITSKAPVVFFTHGYGPNNSIYYMPLINHIVSRGSIVVYAPYPMIRVTMDERYAIVWNGFAAAASTYADRMDLTRVGFVGHSFGGGATPAMAHNGIVDKGWGKAGAFIMELAPWYSYQMTDARFAEFPANVIHAVEVYDLDTANDHRMSMDIHRAMRTRANLYFSVATQTIKGCSLTADHAVPGRSPSIALKQYGLFRPLDVVTQMAFDGKADATALAAIMTPSPEGFQPLSVIEHPQAPQAQDYYAFPWDGEKNPRKAGGLGASAADANSEDGASGRKHRRLRDLIGKTQ